MWYSLQLPTKGWPGWVDLGGWLHNEINVWHRELNSNTVTHPSTSQARRRLTSLIKTNTTTTPDHHHARPPPHFYLKAKSQSISHQKGNLYSTIDKTAITTALNVPISTVLVHEIYQLPWKYLVFVEFSPHYLDNYPGIPAVAVNL